MVIAIRNTYGLENAIRRVSEGQGKILMDSLRLKFKALDQEETRLLREQSLKKDRSFRTIKIVLFIGMIFIVFVFSLTFFSFLFLSRPPPCNFSVA